MRKLIILGAALLSLVLTLPVSAYIIKRGDTLYGLAGKNWPTVAAQNGITDPKKLKVGQDIQLSNSLNLGSTKYVQTQPFSLAGAGVSIGDTTVTLSSFTQIDGTTLLTMADFGSIGFATVEPGNGSLEEQISFTGVTQNANGTATLTGVSHVLFTSPYTATSGFTQTHAGGVTLVISNTSGFYNTFANKGNNELITGAWQFAQLPTSTTSTPTDLSQLVTLYTLQQATSTGGTNGTTTVKGVFQAATDAQLQAGTVLGSTGAVLVGTGQSHSQTSTPNKVPVANGQGVIDPNYIPTSSPFMWSGQNTFNATTTLTTSTIASTTISQANIINSNITASSITNLTVATTTVTNKVASSFPYLLSVTTTALVVSNTSSEIAIMTTTTLASSTMGTNNVIRGRIHVSGWQFTTAGVLTLRLKLGATTLITQTFTNSTGGGIGPMSGGYIDFRLFESGTTAAQSAEMVTSVRDAGVTANSGTSIENAYGTNTGTGTEDTTVNKNLGLTAQWTSANAANLFVADDSEVFLDK